MMRTEDSGRRSESQVGTGCTVCLLHTIPFDSDLEPREAGSAAGSYPGVQGWHSALWILSRAHAASRRLGPRESGVYGYFLEPQTAVSSSVPPVPRSRQKGYN